MPSYYQGVQMGGGRKRKEPCRPWSEGDLALLLQLVNERLAPGGSDEDVDWKAIAAIMGNRTTKQVREKYRNDLRPGISKTAWSPEEDYVLAVAHSQLGNRWSDIAQYLPRRAENTIKNRWYTTQRTKDEGRPRSFLWLYSALACSYPDMNCLELAKSQWNEMVETSNGRMLPLSEFEVPMNYFTTGAGAAQMAALIKAEMAAAALLVPGSMTIHSATARAAANSANSVLAMPMALRAASAHLGGVFASHTLRYPMNSTAEQFDAEVHNGWGGAEAGLGTSSSQLSGDAHESVVPHDGYQWFRMPGDLDMDPACPPKMHFACRHLHCPARKSVHRQEEEEVVVTYYGGDHSHPMPRSDAGTGTGGGAGGSGDVWGSTGGGRRSSEATNSGPSRAHPHSMDGVTRMTPSTDMDASDGRPAKALRAEQPSPAQQAQRAQRAQLGHDGGFMQLAYLDKRRLEALSVNGSGGRRVIDVAVVADESDAADVLLAIAKTASGSVPLGAGYGAKAHKAVEEMAEEVHSHDEDQGVYITYDASRNTHRSVHSAGLPALCAPPAGQDPALGKRTSDQPDAEYLAATHVSHYGSVPVPPGEDDLDDVEREVWMEQARRQQQSQPQQQQQRAGGAERAAAALQPRARTMQQQPASIMSSVMPQLRAVQSAGGYDVSVPPAQVLTPGRRAGQLSRPEVPVPPTGLFAPMPEDQVANYKRMRNQGPSVLQPQPYGVGAGMPVSGGRPMSKLQTQGSGGGAKGMPQGTGTPMMWIPPHMQGPMMAQHAMHHQHMMGGQMLLPGQAMMLSGQQQQQLMVQQGHQQVMAMPQMMVQQGQGQAMQGMHYVVVPSVPAPSWM